MWDSSDLSNLASRKLNLSYGLNIEIIGNVFNRILEKLRKTSIQICNVSEARTVLSIRKIRENDLHKDR